MHRPVLLNVDVDGHPSVYQLYTPEQQQYKDPNLYLWVRRCELFVSMEAIYKHFDVLGIDILKEYIHKDFSELTIMEDWRGYKWYVTLAPIKSLRSIR